MDNRTAIREKYKWIKRLRKAICSVYPEICPYCLIRVDPLETACKRCKKSFPKVGFDRRAIGGFCVSCALPYKAPYDKALKSLKFKGMKQFAPQLAAKLSESIERSYPDLPFDLITYVPLHPNRQKERGYNQSMLLAREVSYILGIPFQNTLTKVKDNPPQHKTDIRHKASNVKNVYKVINKKAIQDKRILLIDDVITSGHTLGENAKTLKNAGASEIFCAVYATAVEKRLEIQENL